MQLVHAVTHSLARLQAQRNSRNKILEQPRTELPAPSTAGIQAEIQGAFEHHRPSKSEIEAASSCKSNLQTSCKWGISNIRIENYTYEILRHSIQRFCFSLLASQAKLSMCEAWTTAGRVSAS